MTASGEEKEHYELLFGCESLWAILVIKPFIQIKNVVNNGEKCIFKWISITGTDFFISV